MAHALTQPLRAIRLGASLCLCACGAVAVDGQKVEAALRAVQDQPKAAAEICAELPSGRWRGECVISAVERLAVSQPALAEGLCAQLEEDDGGVEAHECWFQLAERSHDVALCVRSGSFVEDCRIHVWTARVPTLTAAQTAEGAPLEPALAGLALAAAEHGFTPDDSRPWTALYRHLHHTAGGPTPGLCAGLPAEHLQWCTRAGLGVYRDQLAFLRDSNHFPCGGPPPSVSGQAGEHYRAVYAEVAAQVGCPAATP